MVTRRRGVWAVSAALWLLVAGVSGVSAYPGWAAARSAGAARRALEGGDPTAALVTARRGPDGVALAFLEGSALMALGRWDEASSSFSAVLAQDPSPEITRRTLHNLALSHLRQAAREDAGRGRLHARASVAAGREALRLDPRVDATRWNLALAQRLLAGAPPDAGAQGDRGSVLVEEGPGAGSATGGAGAMTPEEAGRVLDALRSGEAENLRAALNAALEAAAGGTTNRGPPW